MTPRTAPTAATSRSRHPHRNRRALALTLCGAAAALAPGALAATAHADSIVFVKDANVWLANPDGSGQYQVTTDGTADNAYQAPSQADDGTIVAVRALPNRGPIIRMRQNGEVINEIPLPWMQAGPFNPAISPDGRLVAYEHAFTNSFETSNDTRITNVDGLTALAVYGSPGSGAGAPSWIDSNHIFVGDYTSASTMVPGQQPVEWWSDWDHEPLLGYSEDLDDGEVAANGAIAFVRGDRDGNTIQLYRSTGPASLPTPTCTLSNPSAGPLGNRFADPTFSPTGNAIAWQEGDGIWTATLPADDCARAVPRLTIPGASSPDWGPAPVNPGPRPTPPAPPVDTTPRPVPPGAGETSVVPRTSGRSDGVRTTGRSDGARTTGRSEGARTGVSATPSGCAALQGAKRDACALRAAVARCTTGPKRRRAACVKQARRVAAIRACTRKPAKARKQCVAKAKKRYA